jgi:Tat protein secretion system quality control protein TatD with DNase activity
MAQRGRESIDVGRRQRMFLSFGCMMHLLQGQPRFIGEVALEQPVRPDHLKRKSRAIWRQRKFLAARLDQPLRLHPRDDADDGCAAKAERAANGRERSQAAAVLDLEEMLQRVLEPLAIARRPPLPIEPGQDPRQKSKRNEGKKNEEILHSWLVSL